jgi:hypothetical protein
MCVGLVAREGVNRMGVLVGISENNGLVERRVRIILKVLLCK